MRIAWDDYPATASFDELIGPGGTPRLAARALIEFLSALGPEELAARQKAAEVAIRAMGITFTVYHEEGGSIDRAWPLDIIPRVIALDEWRRIEAGLQQRAQALNLFIDDIYHDQRIVQDGVFPREHLANSANYRPQCAGVEPPLRVWAHICGSDLVRGGDGTVYVLEDNLRVPSGVSYMLENRQVVKRVFPEVFEAAGILPVDDYSSQLFDLLRALAPRGVSQPEVVVLTPGIYNSAYFEHAYLAQQMGCELVEGGDLVVGDDDVVYMRTIDGWQRVDVIYRRVDDLFLDPEVFRPDSTLGVRGLMRAWRAGNVALANAPGAGVADDKLVYTYVPAMIRYYLKQDAILPNVPSFICCDEVQRRHVLANLATLVVKPANESGGYGMLMGPKSSAAERERFADLIEKDPRNYIAQPVISLSTTPTLVEGGIEPRHLDLRPFILSGRQVQVTTGGLTRVAMRRGSLVVNSSQGGGSKDTWIVDTAADHAVARS
jgi:uncharacterized circularly permuted ATP-grasp superfamily protein